MKNTTGLSIVIPVYNEEENIAPLVEQLRFLADQFDPLEVLLVDDGSTDTTWKCIEAQSVEFPSLKGIKQLRNAGQSAALQKGIHAAQYEVIVMLDGDLQNDPADIPKLVEALEGFDVVCGYRANRKDTWSKRYGSKLANKIRNMVTHDGIRDTGCTLKAFRRKCANDLPPLEGMHRFMPAYFKINNRKITQIPVNHRNRIHGSSKYSNMMRLPRTLRDLNAFKYYRKRVIPQELIR